MSSTSPDKKPVLILASGHDSHAKAVAMHLRELKVKSFFWQHKQLLGQPSFTWESSIENFICQLKLDNQELLDLSEVSSIWLRRPSLVKAQAMPAQWLECLSSWESQRALEGIYRMLDCLWVNNPKCQQESLLKLYQLHLAKQLGMHVPDTLVTNEADKVSEFYQQHNGQIIYKFIDGESFRYFPAYETARGIPALTFRPDDLKYLDQVKLSLNLFQERIKKTHDLRVTVVGKKIFAVEIQSQWQGENLDWRLTKDAPCRLIELDNQLERQIIKFMQALGLNFGCLDFSVDNSGRSYFLEVNPSGQFLWLEEKLSLPIASELAKLLSGYEEPLIN